MLLNTLLYSMSTHSLLLNSVKQRYSKSIRLVKKAVLTLVLLLIATAVAILSVKYSALFLSAFGWISNNFGVHQPGAILPVYFSLLLLSFIIFVKLMAFNNELSQMSLSPAGDIDARISDHMRGGRELSNDPELKELLDGYKMLVSRSEGVILTENEKIIFVNKYFCKITGYKPADIIGHSLIEFIAPFDLHAYWTIFRQGQGSSSENTFHIICEDKRLFKATLSMVKQPDQVQATMQFIKISDEECTLTGHITHDWFINAVENNGVYIWMWDHKGLLYASPGCNHIAGIPLKKLYKNPGLLMRTVNKADRGMVKEGLKSYEETLMFDMQFRVIRADNTLLWLHVKLSPERDNLGNIVRHVGMALDISYTRQRFEELEAARRKAEEANIHKTAFLADMSHEIRSPLNGIIGFSELLGEPGLTKTERDRYIEIIVNNGTALIGLLNDIIDISKLESGQVKMQLTELCPADLVLSLEDYYKAELYHSSNKVTLKSYIPRGAEKLRIMTDANRLKQVFVNLIGNAIKFTGSGCIETGIELWGNTLVCYVKDTGIGIAADDQAAIFERYKQSGNQKEFAVKGTGLGLAISKALIELMGGNIWLESELDKGSVFYFTIPYKTQNTAAMMNFDEAVNAFPYNWQGRTILIAEDIDFSFLYIETVLKRTGAQILWAQNGRQAVEMVRTTPAIDLVLMDIYLPVMNGYDATKEIKALRPDLPVIAQTAFVLPSDVKLCYAAGCSGYLAKPIRKDLLLRTVSGFLDDPSHSELSNDNLNVYRSKVI